MELTQKYKSIGILFIALLLNSITQAQTVDRSIGITGGYVPDGYGVLISFEYYNNATDFIQLSSLITNNEDRVNNIYKIPYNIATLNLGYYKNILQSRNNSLKLSVGLGGVGGYEYINNDKEKLEDGSLLKSKSGLIYGVYGGFDLELYLNNNLSLIGVLNQYYHINSELGNFTMFAGGGLRYFLN